MRKFVIVAATLFLMGIGVVAQDVTPAPVDPVPTEVSTAPGISADPAMDVNVDDGVQVTVGAGDYPVIDPAAIVATILNAVYGLVMAAFGAAPITVVIVSLLKRIQLFDQFSAPGLTFAVAAVLYIVAIIASVLGYAPQFENFIAFLATAVPALMSFLGTLYGAPMIYEAARSKNVAFIGKSRSDTRASIHYYP